VKNGSIINLRSSGALRTYSFEQSKSETVKIATAVILPEDGKLKSMEDVFKYKKISEYDNTIFKIEDLTEIATSNDAKIISFQEFAIVINEDDRNSLLQRFREIAKKNNVYLSVSYAYVVDEGKGKNIHLFIDNEGNILLDYAKRFLWGWGNHGETAIFWKGAEVIQSTDTPYGKIGISICRDMNFSRYIRQAAKQNVDIMLSPSFDYPRSTRPSYTLRSIEYGFSFVRPTYNGVSFAQDYNGNIINMMDIGNSENGIMYAEVPIKGVKTIYSVIGDLFGWICVFGVLTLIIISIIDRKKRIK